MVDVVAVLAAADGRRGLPRLGGMARAEGVVISSDRFWAFAGTDGSLREGTLGHGSRLGPVPLIRGLVRLAASLTPLFRGEGVARRGERPFLALALIVPFGFVLLPPRLGTVLGTVLTLALIAWLFRGRTRALHGAEHRAIAAAEQGRLLATWHGLEQPTRFARRCGTNFAALVLPVATFAERLWPLPTAVLTPVLVALFSLALTMELWRAVQSSQRLPARLLLLPGLGLQRLTTAEPELAETRIALTAAASVLGRELGE